MLGLVEVERSPAGADLGPGGDSVARDQEAALRPVEGEMAGRMPRGVENLQRADRAALVEQLVHRAGHVLRPPEEEPQLEREQLQRLLREQGDRLRTPVAAD